MHSLLVYAPTPCLNRRERELSHRLIWKEWCKWMTNACICTLPRCPQTPHLTSSLIHWQFDFVGLTQNTSWHGSLRVETLIFP
mgnify:CR=1 FL=1